MPSSTSSVHKTYLHRKKIMRSEISFKSKKNFTVHDNTEKYFKSDFKTKKMSFDRLEVLGSALSRYAPK